MQTRKPGCYPVTGFCPIRAYCCSVSKRCGDLPGSGSNGSCQVHAVQRQWELSPRYPCGRPVKGPCTWTLPGFFNSAGLVGEPIVLLARAGDKATAT